MFNVWNACSGKGFSRILSHGAAKLKKSYKNLHNDQVLLKKTLIIGKNSRHLITGASGHSYRNAPLSSWAIF